MLKSTICNEILRSHWNSYSEKINLPGFIESINMNRIKAEPYVLIFDDALDQLATNCEPNRDPYGDRKNDETTCEINLSSEHEDLTSTDDQPNCTSELKKT